MNECEVCGTVGIVRRVEIVKESGHPFWLTLCGHCAAWMAGVLP